MALFDLSDLRARGFDGYATIRSLARTDPPELPDVSGLYVLLRIAAPSPAFLAASGGGWWKGKDPTVALDRLQREWVDGTPTLYIGKAKSLRERVGELLQFSDGRPVRHWGVRLLWQLDGCQDLLLAWRQEPDFGGAETELIDEFLEHFGRLPFANLKRGDRRR